MGAEERGRVTARDVAPPLAGHEVVKLQQLGVLAAVGGRHPAAGQLAHAACGSGEVWVRDLSGPAQPGGIARRTHQRQHHCWSCMVARAGVRQEEPRLGTAVAGPGPAAIRAMCVGRGGHGSSRRDGDWEEV
jgi:hypothetical protein